MASACTDRDGKTLYVVARHPENGTIWWTHTDANLQTWAGWTEVPGGGTTNLAPTISSTLYGTFNNQHLAALAVGTDDTIHMNLYDVGSDFWSGWVTLGGTTNTPVFGFVSGITFRVFSKGLGDGKVYVKERNLKLTWSNWKHVDGDFLTDFSVTPTRIDGFGAMGLMGLLGIRRDDHQICRKVLEYDVGTTVTTEISQYPSGWAPLPYRATTDAPLAASLSRGFTGFAKGIKDGRIYGLPEKGSFSEVPGNGLTNAGLSSTTLVLSKVKASPTSTVIDYLVRNVLVAKGGDNRIYFNHFDDKVSTFHMDQFP